MLAKKNELNPESFSTAPIPVACSPLQMTEATIDLLGREQVPSDDVQKLLERLVDGLNRRFASRCNVAVFEDVVLRAPWLTTEAERVKQQQSNLLQALKSCCFLSRNLGESLDCCRQLREQLSDFAEQYVETESAMEELFHTAFPGPDWARRD